MISTSKLELGTIPIEVSRKTIDSMHSRCEAGFTKHVHIAYETARVNALRVAKERFESDFEYAIEQLSEPMGGAHVMHRAALAGVEIGRTFLDGACAGIRDATKWADAPPMKRSSVIGRTPGTYEPHRR